MPTRRLWTISEYTKIAEIGIILPDEKVELIGGEIFEMSPQSSEHAMAIVLIDEVLRKVFVGNYVFRPQLPLNLGDENQPEPDLAVVAGRQRDYVDHPTTALLIVEVSKSTLKFDRNEKASLYAKHEIQDYWIVNLIDHQLEIYRRPRMRSDQPFGYGYASMEIYFPDDLVSTIEKPESEIKVADLLP